MPDKDELDVLLDSALATYADRGADAGLERRVLAALEAARESGERRSFLERTRRWLPWTIAVPVMASLLMWIAVNRIAQTSSRQTDLTLKPSISAPVAMPPADTRDEKRPSGAKTQQGSPRLSVRLKSCPLKTEDQGSCFAGRREITAGARLPKLNVFPTPEPLTAEEQVLVAVAQEDSKTGREALLAAQAPTNAALSIAALDIPPLAPPEEGKN